GKTIGVSNAGGSSDIATRAALKNAGLDPDKDVLIQAVGSHANRTLNLLNGTIDAGVDDPPEDLELVKAGLTPLIDLASQKLPAANTGVIMQRSYLNANKDTVQAYVDSLVIARAKMKADKPGAVAVLGKYFKLDNQDALNAAYDFFMNEVTQAYPAVDDQLRVARIASEEIDHCRKFLRMLGMVGLDRSDILFRPRSKREVDAFKVDMPEWGDFAAFGFLIDKVGQYQLDEMVGSSFLPTDDVLPTILREELGHVAYGEQQLEKMMATPDGKIAAQRAIDKWYVVGLDMFGRSESARDERYIEWGLKKRTNGKMREDYIAEMDPKISALGLRVPDKLAGRKYL